MDTQQFKNLINNLIDQKLASMSNMATGNHAHNGYDVNQLDPAIALLGFPVVQVADARVAPTDVPNNGIFRFFVDTTPRYYLWAYINYSNSSGALVGAWKSAVLT